MTDGPSCVRVGPNIVDCFAVGIYPEAAFEKKRFLFPTK